MFWRTMRLTTSLGRPVLTCGAPMVTTPLGARVPPSSRPIPMSRGCDLPWDTAVPPDASAFESAVADGMGAGCGADDPSPSNGADSSELFFADGRAGEGGGATGAAAG